MYLSRLILEHPPRLRELRRDLASPYEMHRTLTRAFPESHPGRALFRLEPFQSDQPPVVLVQSDDAPDWSFLDGMPGWAGGVSVKEFRPAFERGRALRFRLRANPTRKVGTITKADRLAGRPKSNGRRLALLTEAEQRDWLARKGAMGGFRPLPDDTTVIQEDSPRGMGKGFKGKGGDRQRLSLLAVRYEGILEVADPEALLGTLRSGVGPGKGLGFGLLSLAPA